MTIHEVGNPESPKILLLHCACMTWEMFEYAAKELSKSHHVIIPAMPGYDLETDDEYTSVERIAADIEEWFSEKGYSAIDILYGLSMGGSIAIRMLANSKIKIRKAIIDGGITPYPYPKIISYIIGVRDFLMIEWGKHSRKALEMAYPPEKYGDDGVDYMYKVMRHMTAGTIWNTFYSCNNYSMPKGKIATATNLEYWYGENEKKARKQDLEYVKSKFLDVEFKEFPKMDHAELAAIHADEFVKNLIGPAEGM